MVVVQPESCSPIVTAWEHGADSAVPLGNATTAIHGMRVPALCVDALMLKILRECDGFGIAISDDAASEALRRTAQLEVQLLSIEGAAVHVAYDKAANWEAIGESSRVILINSASGQKNEFDKRNNGLRDAFEIGLRCINGSIFIK